MRLTFLFLSALMLAEGASAERAYLSMYASFNAKQCENKSAFVYPDGL